MAPKRVLVEKQGRRGAAPKGFIASTYDTLTSPDNASVVRSVAVFGVRPIRRRISFDMRWLVPQ